MWLVLLALPGFAYDYTSDVVPFLAKPFAGEFANSGVFDHDPKGTGENRQLTPWDTVTWGRSGHDGWDWPMPVGTPILAAADGEVLEAHTKSIRCKGKGRVAATVVRILHEAPDGQPYITGYLHLSEEHMEPGQRVAQGQTIGLSGSSGCSTGPHLHFAVTLVEDLTTLKGPKVDPYGWRADRADPRMSLGHRSAWLWEEGQAPLVYRVIRSGKTPSEHGLKITRMCGTAWNDAEYPNNEWVEIALDGGRGTQTRNISGLELRDADGQRYRFPQGTTLTPGSPVRVYTGSGSDTKTAFFWNQTAGVWDDDGDCAHLVTPRGKVISTQHWGRRKEGLCAPFGGPPAVPDPTAEDDENP